MRSPVQEKVSMSYKYKEYAYLRSRAPARKVRVLLPGILVIVVIGIAIPLISRFNSGCQKLAVPAYFYPGADWTRALTSRPVPSVMIMDITSSGAGGSPDPHYQAAVRRAQAAGIRVIGYSTTNYAQRPAAAVEADVRHYQSWYNVTDIFLDEASSSNSAIPYYRQLSGFIHHMNPGSLVMLNPGIYPSIRYMSLGDVVMVYEDSYPDYLRLRVPGWVNKYPAADFAFAIYDASGSQLANAIRLSQRRHAGYVYVTDGTGNNPYRALPGYWSREDAIVAATCHGLP
jgi:hypothetical protein